MRRIFRNRFPEPEALRGPRMLEEKLALANHYRLPEEERHRRRPPINESQTTDAAWIVMALQGQAGPAAPKSQREALAKAVA